MKKKILLQLVCVAIFSNLLAKDSANSSKTYLTDSLTKLLIAAHDDSTRFCIRYEIARKTAITEINGWEHLLNEARELNLPLYEIRCLTHLGDAYRYHNNPQKMTALFYNALALAQRNNYKHEVLELCKRLQAYYSERLDARRTLFFLYKGLKIAEELNNREAILDLYSALSVFYITSGELQKALDIQLRCLRKCRDMKYDFGIASALLDIGTIYSKQGNINETVRYYLESINYIHAIEGTIYAVQVYTSLADAYRYKKQYDSSEYFIDKAYRLAKQLNDSRGIASTLVAFGYLTLDQGKLADAENKASEALSISKKIGFSAQLPALYELFEQLYTRQGNYAKALDAYKKYVGLRDSLSNEAIRKQGMEKEFTYNLEKKESEYKLLSQQNVIKDLRLRENETLLRQNRYIAAGSLAVLLILSLIIFLFIRQKKFRTEHQRILLEQKLLRTQMNPHFVFNSLNSIQGFVMENDNAHAELYLSRFATLLRDLLESNTKDNLSVAEEVSMLNAYLEMEALRFGGTFKYSVYVDPRIDQYQVQIPHLMIQPFVENAIWHGLLPKAGEQLLTVRFEYHSETTLKCIVEDNGVGREASSGTTNINRKKSLALSFVTQRIELIRKTYKIDGSTTIIDKKDSHNNSLGTTVIVVLPILN
jgi:tetratricopeptide (TPR) repeat protein